MSIYEESLIFHEKYKGKLEIKSRVKVENSQDLSLAYTPGVAEPCRAIHKDPSAAYMYTRKWNTVAVISDGRIVEQGKHEELLEKNGKYAELYKLQFKNSWTQIAPWVAFLVDLK